MYFDKTLQREIARRGLTQCGVAEVMGIPLTRFTYYIHGYRELPRGFEKRFYAALDLLERAEKAAEQARGAVLAGGIK